MIPRSVPRVTPSVPPAGSARQLGALGEVRGAREFGPFLDLGVHGRPAGPYQPQGVGAEQQVCYEEKPGVVGPVGAAVTEIELAR